MPQEHSFALFLDKIPKNESWNSSKKIEKVKTLGSTEKGKKNEIEN